MGDMGDMYRALRTHKKNLENKTMTTFSELLKKGYSLHRRIIKDEKTVAIVTVTPQGDFEYWVKSENGNLEFEKNIYDFASNNQNHISKMLFSSHAIEIIFC